MAEGLLQKFWQLLCGNLTKRSQTLEFHRMLCLKRMMNHVFSFFIFALLGVLLDRYLNYKKVFEKSLEILLLFGHYQLKNRG